jgi:hypothetical protein
MNELELYVDSLDPSLSNEEKVRLVQEWKKANRWKEQEVEVSEKVELEEVDLGTVKKKDGVAGADAPSISAAPEDTDLALEDGSLDSQKRISTRLSATERQKARKERLEKIKKSDNWEDTFASEIKSPKFEDLNTNQIQSLQDKATQELEEAYSIYDDYSIDSTDVRLKAISIFENQILPKVSFEKDTKLETFVKDYIPILNPYADFISDLYTAGAQGIKTSELVDPTFELLKKGVETPDIDIINWINKNKEIASETIQSDEMRDFNKIYEENGSGVFGFLKGVANNPSILPSLLVSSVATQAGSLFGSEEVALAAGTGAVTGAGFGSVVPGIGTATGAIGGAIAGGASAMEASLTFSELLQEEVGDDLTLESVKELFEDEERVLDLKRKAIARGVTIGLVEGITGSIAKGVTGKVLKAGFKKPVSSIAGLTVETAGGSTGEILGRVAAGQEMDIAEIGFEGITGLSSAPLTVGSELVKLNNSISKYKLKKELKNTNFEKVSQAFNPEFPTTGFEIKASQEKNSLEIIDKEVDLDVREGNITKEQGNNIKNRAREVQGAVNQLKPLNISIDNQPAIVDLMIEQKNLKNTIKQVDNSSLTKAESARLSEIDTELGDLITKDKAEKIDIGAKKIAEEIGVGFEAFDTQADVDSAIATLQEEGGKIDTKNSDNYGTFVVLPDGRRIIILNKETATEDRTFTEGQHETAHAITYETVKNNPQAAIALGQALLNEIRTNKDINIKPGFQARLDQYIQDANISQADTMEEVMTLVSDGLTDGTIEINETIGVKIGNFIRRALSTMGMKVKFKDGKDVLNFIKDYNRSVHRQQGLSRGLKKAAVEGVEVDITPQEVTDLKQSVAKESKRLEGSNEIQNIYNEKGVSGAMDIIQKLKPITNKIVESRSQAPNFDRQLLTDEIETGQRGILDLIMSYDPTKDTKLFTYIYGQLPKRAIEASRRVLGEEFTADVTEAKGVIAEEVAETVTKEKPIAKKPTETVEFSQTQIEKIGAKDKAEVETRITEATNEAFKGQDIKTFGQTT